MPGSCIVCKSSPERTGVTLHCVPADEPRRQKWIGWIRQRSNNPYFLPKDYHKVCSLHFRPTDYKMSRRGPLLLRTAVPIHEVSTTDYWVPGIFRTSLPRNEDSADSMASLCPAVVPLAPPSPSPSPAPGPAGPAEASEFVMDFQVDSMQPKLEFVSPPPSPGSPSQPDGHQVFCKREDAQHPDGPSILPEEDPLGYEGACSSERLLDESALLQQLSDLVCAERQRAGALERTVEGLRCRQEARARRAPHHRALDRVLEAAERGDEAAAALADDVIGFRPPDDL